MNNNNIKINDDHEQEHDMVMPGFRFHPTEEELIEFYLRRKVEGNRFNVELITFLDLYRYDPWELPALAAIGEKEWFFYVPRDRKYRNGDRPNRVTTSGYWKATGADRIIKSETETSRSIGLKKTLVFYSGKAPKGIRTSWIMNEYRLPQHQTPRYHKTEISLCRVYKRAGFEDHPSIPGSLPSSRASSSRSVSSASTMQSDKDEHYPHHRHHQDAAAHHHFAIERISQAYGGGQSSHQQMDMSAEKMSNNTDQTDGSSSCSDVTTVLGLSKQNVHRRNMAPITPSLGLPSLLMEDEAGSFLDQSKQSLAAAVAYSSSSLVPVSTTTLIPAAAAALSSSFSSSAVSSNASADEFQRLLTYQQASMNQQQHYYNNQHHQHHLQFSTLLAQSQPLLALHTLPVAFSDRLWELNPIPESNSREYIDPFK